MPDLHNNRRVAIVGFSFRLPGTQPDQLWPALCKGESLVDRVDPGRWAQEAFYHPDKSEPGSAYTFAAGTVEGVDAFDAGFFGISPREASQMDPQQRFLLELAWEALERGGIKPSAIRGRRTGVYVGLSSTDYGYRRVDDLAAVDASTITGTSASIAANRISYQFDFRGPSMAIDTACSSSLVAFHQACQAIAAGECPEALVGGINLHLHPLAFVGFSKASMLSKRGLCNVFDAHADGYVRAEGGGVFVLKDLDQALRDGNRIYAVVAGSGINCDGRTKGLTVPCPDAQARLLREVYSRAGVAPEDVDYLEAHGTGTAVGDPIETEALGMALGKHRPAGSPLPIGSVKSNLGHLEAASGVAGLVKGLLCLEHRAVPPTIHLESPNPGIRFNEWNLEAVTELKPLPAGKKLVVGVNSFGFGGANAHVILESAPACANALPAAPFAAEAPVVVSGRSPAALRAAAAQYAALLRGANAATRYDIAFCAAYYREFHAHRGVAFGTGRASIADSLEGFAEGKESAGIATGIALAQPSEVAFVYSGNGSQWAGMGRNLLAEDKTFRAAVEAVDALFRIEGDFSILAELQLDEASSRLRLTEVAQPLLFALQVGLTEMLRERGLAPAAVAGHSVGEVAAAWAAGALTLPQAVRVIAVRSSRQGTTRGDWGMTAVGLGREPALDLLSELGLEGRLSLAGINSPQGVTLAGSREELDRLDDALAQRDIFFRRLALDYAFHSPAMDGLEPDILSLLAGLAPSEAAIPFVSTVTGEELAGTQLDAAYWWRNVREPVQFENAIRGLVQRDIRIHLEIGPHPVLRTYIGDCLRDAGVEGRVIPTLTRTDAGSSQVTGAFHQALIAGASVDLAKLFPVPGRFVDLPRYPWQRERHWYPATSEAYHLIDRHKEHPLLGYRLRESADRWENHLDTALYPLYRDHVVGGATVFPAAGFIEMALAASRLKFGGSAHEIEELEIRAPLLLDHGRSRTVRFNFDPTDGRFAIESRERLSEEPWLLNVTGRLLGNPAAVGAVSPAKLPKRRPDVPAAAHYRSAEAVGLAYGPAFRTVAEIWLDGGTVLARLAAPETVVDETERHCLHPALLDGCFQLLVDALADEQGGASLAFVPVKLGWLRLDRPGTAVSFARGRIRRRNPRSLAADFTLYDAAGQTVADLREVRFAAVQFAGDALDELMHLAVRAVPAPRAASAERAALPPVETLAQAAAERLHEPARVRERTVYYEEVEPLLDALCAAFAEAALRPETAKSPLVPEMLVSQGRVAAEAKPLLLRLLEILREDGLIEPAGEGWRWQAVADLPDPREIWISLLEDYSDYAAEILLLGRIGLHLPEILAGRQSVHDLLPQRSLLLSGPGGSIRNSVGAALLDMARTALQHLPQGRRLRVLEYCLDSRPGLAGLGFADLDPDRCDYWAVGPQPALLDDPAKLKERHPGLEFGLLNLESPDASPCGIPGLFDLALLPDGLSFAADSGTALANLNALLTPGGLLVFAERHPCRSAELIGGLMAGGREDGGAQLYRDSGLRPAARWRALLEERGFQGVEILWDLPGMEAGAFLVLARSGEAPADKAPAPAWPGTWLLLQDEAGHSASLGDRLEAELRTRDQRVIRALGGTADSGAARFGEEEARLDLCSESDVRALADWVRELGGMDGVIHLAGLRRGDSSSPPSGLARRCHMLALWLRAAEDAGLTMPGWLVTKGAGAHLLPETARAGSARPAGDVADAALLGYARTLMNEHPGSRLRLVDVCVDGDPDRAAAELACEVLQPDAEDEILLMPSGRYGTRLRRLPREALVPHAGLDQAVHSIARLDFPAGGSLKNLGWQSHTLRTPAADEIDVEVRAAGLNFRDVMYAMGMLSDEAVENGFAGPSLGMELSGVVVNVGSDVDDFAPGDEVIAFAPASFGTRAITKGNAAVAKPPDWSFESAATIPTAFFTAYYALHHLGHLREGERVLIHGAAGGVGIASIQLAKLFGAEIFATAGSERKRDFLRLLGVDQVMDSRSLAYADQIMEATKGEGVDVVLNSLAGEAIRRNLRILKPFGRFLELGKRDFYENTRIGLRPFRNNIAYFGIDADQLMIQRPDLTRRLFLELMALFERGALKPLPYRSFAGAEVVDAFRYMQQSRQIGKVVVSFAEGVPTPADGPHGNALKLRRDGTYLVTGGLRGFGLKTAQWLAEKGARCLVLVSRGGIAAPEDQPTLTELERKGVQVHAAACDVADEAALTALMQRIARDLPPLRGVIHAAAVIEDGLARNATPEQLDRVLAPKVLGAWHLDKLTRDLPLDFMVFYSSATTAFGNPGQGGYVAANSYLEALAAARRAEGLPALCIGWGALGDTGYLVRNPAVKEALQAHMGAAVLDSAEALDILEQSLQGDGPDRAVLRLDWSTMRRFLPSARSPKFRDLARLAGDVATEAGGPEQVRRWLAELTDEELSARLGELLKKDIGHILRIPPESLEDQKSIHDLGMDSLMGTELAAAVESRCGVRLPTMALSEGPSIARIADRIVRQLRAEQAGVGGEADLGEQIREVAQRYAGDIGKEQRAAIEASLRDAAPPPRAAAGP
jgi:acyl transferase domain-containing protein/NADPH:quinone reductase-like Zn-dependent oxidoreductase/acyl carrier protein/SAM-dependent methyltransferase